MICVWTPIFCISYYFSCHPHIRAPAVAAVLNARAKLVLSGSLLANALHNLLVSVVLGHVHTQLPFRKDTLRALCVLIECLKVLQVTFHRRSTLLAENMAHLIGQAQFTLKRIFAPMKAQARSGWNGSQMARGGNHHGHESW